MKTIRKRLGVNQRSECPVSGVLKLILRISQLFGVAPLQFQDRNGTCIISLSLSMCCYSFTLISLLNVICLTGLSLDLQLPLEQSVRVRTTMTRVVWIADLFIVICISSFGAYSAPRRMRCMIEQLNQLYKINYNLNNINTSEIAETEKRRSVIVVLGLIFVVVLLILDYWIFLNEALITHREWKITVMYTFYYVEYFMMTLLELQFIFLALAVQSGLNAVNKSLVQLLYIIDIHIKQGYHQVTSLISTTVRHPIKSINIAIDSMAIYGNPANDTDCNTNLKIKPINQIIRHLSLAYGSLCDIVRQVDRNNGVLVMLFLVSFLLHLIVTPYYGILNIENSIRVSVLVLQMCFCIFHTLNMVITVEPCHRTQEELKRTRLLVSQLFQKTTSPSDPLYVELEILSRQLTLNTVEYSPLGMCTLARPLIAKMFGGVATYLVVIIQFQNLSEQNVI